jgi:hypothetical protein
MNRANNVPHTDDSRLENVGMKDILSEPEPNRLKFSGKNDLVSPEIEEREFDLNLSEDDDSRYESSNSPTVIKPLKIKADEKQKKPKY